LNNISFDSQPLDLIPAHITSIKCLVFSYICDRRDLFSRVIIGALLLLLPNELASFHIQQPRQQSLTAGRQFWSQFGGKQSGKTIDYQCDPDGYLL
jgi:hypothetical protein